MGSHHRYSLLLTLFLLANFSWLSVLLAASISNKPAPLKRSDFPPDFIFGTASSAYQIEGAPFEDGKGPSIWDKFSHKNSDKIADGSNGDVAVDFYHRYKENVQHRKFLGLKGFRFPFSWSRVLTGWKINRAVKKAGITLYDNLIEKQFSYGDDIAGNLCHRCREDIRLLKFIGLDSFRLSISWPRLIPNGKLSEGVNKAGIAFYSNLIDELLSNGITPFVTIFHWDLPQNLEEEYGGFRSSRIVDDFVDFADLCFKEFGNRVKHWSTFNEPLTFTAGGYDLGNLAPGRCSAWRNNNCSAGDSATEPYLVAHNVLLSHAAVSDLYRKKYKPSQNGEIGIVLNPIWYAPYSNSNVDTEAAQRALEFEYGWFMDPLVFGDYPQSMRSLVGTRLPKFTAEQSKLVKGSFDFLGINYYSGSFAANAPYIGNGPNVSYSTDSQTHQTTVRNGVPIGEAEGVPGLFVYPEGLRRVLVYTKEKYGNPTIYITENGYGQGKVSTVEEGVKDIARARFYESHIRAVKQAIDVGVKVKGFFPWSFMDMWEWQSGYTQNFGLVFVDRKNGLKRYPKHSALWFKKFLKA